MGRDDDRGAGTTAHEKGRADYFEMDGPTEEMQMTEEGQIRVFWGFAR